MKEIEIKDKLSNTLVIDIKLSNKINIIDGNSGTGKTFVYDIINKNKVANIICINKDTIDSWKYIKSPVENFKEILEDNDNTLFIIDRADEIFAEYPEIIDIICNDKSSNTFLLFTRETIFAQDLNTWHTINYDKNSDKITIEKVL